MSKNSIEQSIDAGLKGPEEASWYQHWEQFSDKPFSVAAKVKPIIFEALPPNFAQLKKAQTVVAGADIGKTTKVSGRIICATDADADSIAKALDEFVTMGQQAVAAQKASTKQSGEELAYVFSEQLLDTTKIKQVGSGVEIESAFKIDFDSMLPMLTATYEATKRTEAANNLRTIAISFHNFHDAYKRLPSSVFTHESGKKYSWRIAILRLSKK